MTFAPGLDNPCCQKHLQHTQLGQAKFARKQQSCSTITHPRAVLQRLNYVSDPSEDVTAALTDLENFHKDTLVDPCFGFVMCATPSSLGQSLPQEVFATHSTMSGFHPVA